MAEKRMMAYVEKKKSPEEKEYLICIANNDDYCDWNIIIGRTEAYEYIKSAMEYIDLELSFILVETAKLSERKSIYDFMKYAGEFYNDGFDIEDYVKGDWYTPADDEDIEPGANDTQDGRLNMEDFMNDTINIVGKEGE